MPNRIIKESICTSDNLNELTPEQEVFFYRLMVNCDDFGRMDARPQILLARCFPLKLHAVTTDNVEQWLQALVQQNLVMLYESEGRQYLQMVTWDKHQQKRAKNSKYPAPPTPPTSDNNNDDLISDDIRCNQVQSNVPEKREARNENTRSEKRECGDEKTPTHSKKSKPKQEPKIKYADFVSMTEKEHQKLIDRYGEQDAARMIEILNNYKGSKGKTYKSDYLAILNWVTRRLEEEKARSPSRKVVNLRREEDTNEYPDNW